MANSSGGDSKNTLYCSFCGKSQHEVRKLIAGPTVFICDECVELCMDIIREETKTAGLKSSEGVPTPREICDVLDDYVIGQAMAGLGRRPALMGTLGWGALGSLSASQLTTPDALTLQRQAAQLCDEGCDVLALEASSHALDQARLSGTNLDVAVFTNLTRDHLDYHGSMTEYFEAKARLFDLPGLKHRVVAVDDEWGVKLGQRYPDAWLVGAPENAVRARSVQVIDVQ